MVTRIALPLFVLLGLAAVSLVADDKKPEGGAAKHAGLEQFKLLAGDWVGKELGKDGHDVNIRYKVTAGGSAVVETIFPGSDHEMVTLIHADGPDLLLTHYCMLGNQPQMKAAGKGDGKTIEFKFVRATNLKSEKDMHMHDATFTFVDKDTLKTEWTHFKDGKDSGKVVFDLKRKK